MHVPKLLVVSFFSAAVLSVPVRAQNANDTDIQAKARAALRGADAADTNVPAPPPAMTQQTPPPVAPVAPAKPASPPMQPAEPPPMVGHPALPAPPASTLTPEQEQQLRNLLRQDESSTPPLRVAIPPPAKPPKVPSPAVTAPTPVVKPVPTPVVATPKPVVKPVPAPVVKAPSPVVPPAAPAVNTPTPVVTAPPPPPPPAVTGPAPGSKEARLQDLLNDYKADKITPADYQQRRAQIMAEPDK